MSHEPWVETVGQPVVNRSGPLRVARQSRTNLRSRHRLRDPIEWEGGRQLPHEAQIGAAPRLFHLGELDDGGVASPLRAAACTSMKGEG